MLTYMEEYYKCRESALHSAGLQNLIELEMQKYLDNIVDISYVHNIIPVYISQH
jgi:hypothetical protein